MISLTDRKLKMQFKISCGWSSRVKGILLIIGFLIMVEFSLILGGDLLTKAGLFLVA